MCCQRCILQMKGHENLHENLQMVWLERMDSLGLSLVQSLAKYVNNTINSLRSGKGSIPAPRGPGKVQYQQQGDRERFNTSNKGTGKGSIPAPRGPGFKTSTKGTGKGSKPAPKGPVGFNTSNKDRERFKTNAKGLLWDSKLMPKGRDEVQS